jgi:hypothetical protein
MLSGEVAQIARIESTRYWLRYIARVRYWRQERPKVRRQLQSYESFLAKVRAFAQSNGFKLRRVSIRDVRAFASVPENGFLCAGLVDQICAAIPALADAA